MRSCRRPKGSMLVSPWFPNRGELDAEEPVCAAISNSLTRLLAVGLVVGRQRGVLSGGTGLWQTCHCSLFPCSIDVSYSLEEWKVPFLAEASWRGHVAGLFEPLVLQEDSLSVLFRRTGSPVRVS